MISSFHKERSTSFNKLDVSASFIVPSYLCAMLPCSSPILCWSPINQHIDCLKGMRKVLLGWSVFITWATMHTLVAPYQDFIFTTSHNLNSGFIIYIYYYSNVSLAMQCNLSCYHLAIYQFEFVVKSNFTHKKCLVFHCFCQIGQIIQLQSSKDVVKENNSSLFCLCS